MIDCDVAVVVPAAGQSERFPGQCPKQYFPILGKPLFMHCVEAFINTDSVKKICIVSDRVEYVGKMFDKSGKVMVVTGGLSRHASIKNGLDALRGLGISFRVVVVHDGARPVVPEQLLKDLIVEAGRVGAAGATRPLTSTVLRPGANGCVDLCLDRSSHVASETPQAFDFDTLCSAYEKASVEDLENGTECLDLVLKYSGVRGKLVPGPDTLWKVTEKKDCYASLAYLRELSTRVLILAEEETDLVSALKNGLLAKVNELTVQTPKFKLLSSIYNAIVCLHNDCLDQTAIFSDSDSQGVVIHVVIENSEQKYPVSVEELIQRGRAIEANYKTLGKGVIFIYVRPPIQQDRLIRLITSIILNDWDLFSGQTLFL